MHNGPLLGAVIFFRSQAVTEMKFHQLTKLSCNYTILVLYYSQRVPSVYVAVLPSPRPLPGNFAAVRLAFPCQSTPSASQGALRGVGCSPVQIRALWLAFV